MTAPSNRCSQENFCHAAKGVGYFFEASGCSVALLVVAAVVAAIAVGLLAWDGLFVYSIGMKAPLHLLWAIPVTLAFLAVDLFIILSVAKQAEKAGRCLLNAIKESGGQMVNQFKAIQLNANRPLA